MINLVRFCSAAIISAFIIIVPLMSIASVGSARELISKIEASGINENTNPEIKKLYDELSDTLKQHDQLRQSYESDLRDNAAAMREKEQSTTNKLIGAVGIGSVGIGAMQAASAMAEQKVDANAEQDMTAYLETFRCDYGGGTQFKIGDINIEIPGASQLLTLRNEYIELAARLKEAKTALEMAAGIESEKIIDISQAGLYDDVAIGKTDGAYASLSRAILDETGTDATQIQEQQSKTQSKLKTGAIVAGVGAVGSAAASLIANKDAPKEKSAQIKNEYESQRNELESNINDTEARLNDIIDVNRQKIDEYNKLLALHKQFIESIRGTECAKELAEYITYIDGLAPIENEMQSTDNLEIKYDLDAQKQIYQQCIDLEKQRAECVANPDKEWADGRCIDKPVIFEIPSDEESNNDVDDENIDNADIDDSDIEAPAIVIDDITDPDQCPAVNERLRTLTDKNRVGDFCSYGHVTVGHVTKHKSGQYKGQCTCTADACETGYRLTQNYICERIPGMCKEEYIPLPEQSSNRYESRLSSLQQSTMHKLESSDTCIAACDEYAKKQNCTPNGRHGYDDGKKQCRCNYFPACHEKSHPFSTAQSTVPDTNGKLPIEICNLFCQKQAEKDLCAINGSVRYDNNQCMCNYADRTKMAAKLKFYAICDGDSAPSGSIGKCIEDFKDANVQLLQARALAAEYALIRNGVEIYCMNDDYTEWNDDYLRCTSYNNKYYYDFQFDDVYESIDGDIQYSVKRALCKIYNGYSDNGTACSNISQETCTGKFATSAAKFGYSAEWKNNRCILSQRDESSLARIDGIDPYIFYNGIQIQANGTVAERLGAYVTRTLGYDTVKDFTCESNPRQARKIEGRSADGTTDDILRCKINGTDDVDFVFDDMSEFSTTLSRGGYQNIDCKVVGGEYNGKDCMYLDKPTCESLANLNSDSCPTCQQIHWDDKEGLCLMPSAAAATELQKNIDRGIIVAGAVGGVLITVATGGTGVVALGLLAVETAGAAIELASNETIYNAVDKFLDESRKCKDANCAQSMLKTNLQKMSDFANDVPAEQVYGVDAELARLAELIPTDSTFYQELIENGPSTADNNKGIESWQPAEIWRAVGLTMQLASVFKSVWGFAARKLTKATGALRKGMTEAAKRPDAIKMTASQAKRLDEIDARIAKIKNTPNSADELKKLNQERNTILNKVGSKDAEVVEVAKKTAYSEKEIADAQSELQKAKDALAKRKKWEAENPGAAKNDLQSKNSNGYKVRQDVTAAENKLKEMGIEFEPSDVSLPDGTATPSGSTRTSGTANGTDGKSGASDKNTRTSLGGNDKNAGNTNAGTNTGGGTESTNGTGGKSSQTSAESATDDVASGSAKTGMHARTDEEILESYKNLDGEIYDVGADATDTPSILKKWGLDANATKEDARAKRNRLIQKYHPDKCGSNCVKLSNGESAATEISKNINIEYEKLLKELPDAPRTGGSNASAAHSGKATGGASQGAKSGAQAAQSAPSALENMRKRTGINDLFEVAADKNSAKVKQFRKTVSSEEEADRIVAELKAKNIYAGKIQKGGGNYLVAIVENSEDYEKLRQYIHKPKSATASGASGARSGATKLTEDNKSIANALSTVGYKQHNDFFISEKVAGGSADTIVSKIKSTGNYAVKLNTTGSSSNAEYIVISISKSQADNMGYVVKNGNLLRNISNPNITNLNKKIGKELGRVHGKKVFIESLDDYGVVNGRPIVVVKVGERKIPFYVSTGTAGKTDVPTGKWEFFGGIDSKSGWFNKGGLNDILNHYGSPELKQIADILDSKIGDLRNEELVLETMGRQSLGGRGIVAKATGPEIKISNINRDLKYTPGKGLDIFFDNLDDIKNYLKNL